VFLEPQSGAPAEYAESLTSLGSSSALSTVAGGLKITAIGEVPARTVRAIASALRLAALGAAPGMSGGQASDTGRPGSLPAAAWAFAPRVPGPGPAASLRGPARAGEAAPAPSTAPALGLNPSSARPRGPGAHP